MTPIGVRTSVGKTLYLTEKFVRGDFTYPRSSHRILRENGADKGLATGGEHTVKRWHAKLVLNRHLGNAGIRSSTFGIIETAR